MAEFGPKNFLCKDGRSLVIRHVTAGDVDSFMRFQPKIAAESQFTYQKVGFTPDPTKLAERWDSWIKNPRELRISAFDGNETVAQLGFHMEHPNHPWMQHVGRFGMMVIKEYWGVGLGRRLLEIMEAHARTHSFRRIEATVRSDNARGIALYQKAGFEIEGTRRQNTFIDGVYYDSYYIAKILK